MHNENEKYFNTKKPLRTSLTVFVLIFILLVAFLFIKGLPAGLTFASASILSVLGFFILVLIIGGYPSFGDTCFFVKNIWFPSRMKIGYKDMDTVWIMKSTSGHITLLVRKKNRKAYRRFYVECMSRDMVPELKRDLKAHGVSVKGNGVS